jgi:hypothetical protein
MGVRITELHSLKMCLLWCNAVSLVNRNQHFGGTFCFSLQWRRAKSWMRQEVPAKCYYLQDYMTSQSQLQLLIFIAIFNLKSKQKWRGQRLCHQFTKPFFKAVMHFPLDKHQAFETTTTICLCPPVRYKLRRLWICNISHTRFINMLQEIYFLKPVAQD